MRNAYMDLDATRAFIRKGFPPSAVVHLERRDAILDNDPFCADCNVEHGSGVDEDGRIYTPAERSLMSSVMMEPVFLHLVGTEMLCWQCEAKRLNAKLKEVAA